ncbi:MAG: cytochrome C [Alphaproteobacteria bacterium]
MRLILISTGLAVGVLIACTPPIPPSSAASDFSDLCAPCHGKGGRGDGPMAAELVKKPADLTQLSARNGGTFPLEKVMNKIWGYSRGSAEPSMMPHFAPLMDSPTVPVDLGDGIETPTPTRLIELADYLRTLQG